MNFENQIIFFFSALGAFNGFLLSIYIVKTSKKRQFSNYFLALLILVVSIRIIKSVFLYFNSQISNVFIQIGLSACILIGPFLFLYLKTHFLKKKVNWIIHSIPFLVGITILGLVYPYLEHRTVWSKWIVKGIYLQWFIYIVISFRYVYPIIGKFRSKESFKNIDFWLLSIYFGVALIWLAYCIGAYTSYIVGALSFSFVLYLSILFWVLKRRKANLFFEDPEKYADKKITEKQAKKIIIQLNTLLQSEALHKNPNIKLKHLAEKLEVSSHFLSQLLNDNLDKSFSEYINGWRVESAKKLIKNNTNFTLEAIGFEAGFSSKSSFYSTFKKVTGVTPAVYKKQVS